MPLARVATAWQSEDTAQTYILVMNEALWMGDSMESTFINPNQLRHYGIHIQDDPSSIILLSMISEDTEFAMTLKREGTILYFDTHTPTQKELETYPHIIISLEVSWNPIKVHFDENSHSLEEEVERIRRVRSIYSKNKKNKIKQWINRDEQKSTATIFNLSNISRRIASMSVTNPNTTNDNVRKKTDVKDLRTFESSSRHSDVSPEDLSERWFISISQVTKTLKSTTQNLLRSAVLPLSRRYRADRMFRQKTLDGQWSTDTLNR